MRKVICSIIIVIILFSCCSCSFEKVVNLGDNQKSSNSPIDENIDFSVPTIHDKRWYGIGEDVKDFSKNSTQGMKLSYKVTNIKIYNTIEEAGLSPDDILMYEVFCNKDGEFDTNYKLLLISMNIHCSEKQKDMCYRPNITRLSSVGIINNFGIYESVSTEQIYFLKENDKKLPNEKDYFYYDIDEGATVSVCCGWMIPKINKSEDLFLSIGSVSYSSDGTVNDDAMYICLDKEG